ASVASAIRQLSAHDVVEDSDGLHAFHLLGRQVFDLLLLDVALPGLDGFELCRRVRGQEATENVPVVFLTATHAEVESRLRGLEGSLRVAADVAGLARQAIGRETVCDGAISHGGRQFEVRSYPAAGHRALVYARDVTLQRDEEVRRLQSEKLASIGMLSAGV